MRAVDLFQETASAFNANRARSLLTILGVVIGIAAVIAMTALIGGVKNSLMNEMGMSQARLVQVYCFYGREMTTDDAAAMQNELSSTYEVVVPTMNGSADITSSKEKASAMITGTDAAYEYVMGVKVLQGRFFTEDEAQSGDAVAVIDQASVKKLFGNENAQVAGQAIQIGNREFTIVGVAESRAGGGYGDSVTVYMPLRTCQQRITGTNAVSQMLGLAVEGADIKRWNSPRANG